MSLQTLSATEYVTLNLRCTTCGRNRCITSTKSNHYLRILFYSGNLTTAIDVTVYRTITNNNSCVAIGIIGISTSVVGSYHGFVTEEIVCFTLATAEDISCDSHLLGTFCNRNSVSIYFLSTDVYQGVTRDISQVTTTIDIAQNIGTQYGLSCTHRINATCVDALVKFDCSFGSDINRSVTNDLRLITTAKDAAIIRRAACIHSNSTKFRSSDITTISICFYTINLVDIHNRITIDSSART